MRRVKQMCARIVQHGTPTGRRRRHTQPQKAERGLGEHGSGHADGGLHHQWLNDIGQNVTQKNAEVARAQRARSFDKLALPHGQHLRPDKAGVANPSANRQGKDQIEKSGAKKRHKGNGEQDSRHGHEGIHGEHVDDGIQNAAVKTGDAAEDKPQQQGNCYDGSCNLQRDARAINDARKNIAAQFVRAEPMLRTGRGKAVQQVDVVRAVGREPWRKESADNKKHHQRRADVGEWFFTKSCPMGREIQSSMIMPTTGKAGKFGVDGVRRMVRGMRKRVAILLAALCGCLLAAAPAMAQRDGGDAAQAIFRLTNQDRAQHGLAPLRWSAHLQRAAESHLELMLGKRELMHQYPGEAALPERARTAGVGFSEVAENLAAGFNPKSIENGWMHSPAHRQNILDPGLDAVGIATARHYGRLYVVEDFAHAIPMRGPQQVEQRVGELLRRQGINPDGPQGPAEAACASSRGVPGGPHVRLVIRFQTSNLNALPPQVVDALHRGHYTSAGVGACAPEGAQPGFTTFRVAILLY